VIILLTARHQILQQAESRSGVPDEDGQRSPHLMGASISGLRQVEALVAAPFVDRVITYAPPGLRSAASQALEESRFAGRVEVQDEGEIRAALGPDDPVVIVNLGPNLLRGQVLRWAAGNRRWPICGFTYSIATSGIFQSLVLASASGFQPYDSIFCCSTGIRASMERVLDCIAGHIPGLRRPRLPVVPLGLRAADFQPVPRAEARRALSLPDDGVVFLYLGRIDPRYKANLQPLLAAFSRLKRSSHPLLVVAGAQPDSSGAEILDRLRFRCVELGIADRVRWHTDVPAEMRKRLLSAADVFVSPADNLQESFGLAIVEAMCAGLPVIASDWDGYRDIVAHRRTGFLVPTRLPEDISALSRHAALSSEYDFHWEVAETTVVDISAFEQAMARLAGDPGQRQEMGRAGRERATTLFDWEVVMQRSREEWEAQLDMARSAAEPPPSPLLLDHGIVFSTHPTERLDGRARLRRTPEALLPSVIVSLPPPFLSRELLQGIIESTAEAVALERLPGDSATTTQHAAYLLKHGLLEIVG
jgi:glycosyltransferase involved in cell wall biosynthesis